MSFNEAITQYTANLQHRYLLRARHLSSSLNSKSISFDRNDYLSLILDKRIAKANQDAFSLFPAGSGGSMLLSGYHRTHQLLEREFATLLAVDNCILYSSGYAANLAVTSLLGAIKANAVIDREMHASIYDGLSLAKILYRRYRTIAQLKQQLEGLRHAAVITEGIFSMTGRKPDLTAISALCHQNQAALIVDEAHSFGVIGDQGRGAVSACHLTQQEVPLRIIPLGKAFAAQGAIVAGKGEWIEALLQAGRTLTYSTAVSPALSYGLLKNLELVRAAEDRREKLRKLIACFKESINSSPFTWSESDTPIQQLQLGNPQLAIYYAEELKKSGFSCSVVRSPTVSVKNTGLRVILNYVHEPSHIYNLFNKLHAIYEHIHS